MASQFNLTLQEVVQIALGVPRLNRDNIKILHSLFEFLLRKLDCQEEKVTLGGFAAMTAIRNRQSHAKAAAIRIDVEDLAPLSDQYHKMEALEREISRIEKKLDAHLKHIEKPYRRMPFLSTTWQRYSLPTDDICFLSCFQKGCMCVECNLLYRPDFVDRLKLRSSKPLEERMRKLLAELDEIQVHFRRFVRIVEEQAKNLPTITGCIYQTEHLRQKIADNMQMFQKTLHEFKTMLHAKLSKVHREPMELFIRDWCHSKLLEMEKMLTQTICPPEFEEIKENATKCLSCGIDPLNEEKRMKAIAEKERLKFELMIKKCECNLAAIFNLQAKHKELRLSEATMRSLFGEEIKLDKFRYSIMVPNKTIKFPEQNS